MKLKPPPAENPGFQSLCIESDVIVGEMKLLRDDPKGLNSVKMTKLVNKLTKIGDQMQQSYDQRHAADPPYLLS